LPDGRLDGAAVIIYYGNMAAYRHSGSLNLDSRYPTSYLLQWHAIQEAKGRGMEWYNFWGIAPENATKKHPFFGITHFKKGFGGENKKLLYCQDFRINKTRYLLTKIIETIRRIRRGF
jgi:lipid II:glycine glycyltransferase (peptidoglycan interpeptide bridge formation enzyme)